MNTLSTIPSDVTTLQDLERYAEATGQDFMALLAERGGEARPYMSVSNVLGELRVGEHTFPYRRIDYREQDGPDFSSYRLDLGPHRGEVAVERTGMHSEGPWGVDLYRVADGADSRLTADEAREWADALRGAADLADRLNRVGAA